MVSRGKVDILFVHNWFVMLINICVPLVPIHLIPLISLCMQCMFTSIMVDALLVTHCNPPYYNMP